MKAVANYIFHHSTFWKEVSQLVEFLFSDFSALGAR